MVLQTLTASAGCFRVRASASTSGGGDPEDTRGGDAPEDIRDVDPRWIEKELMKMDDDFPRR
jgi:hypothetical protein